MKEVPVSNSERAFVHEAIAAKQRLDGRDFEQHRTMQLNFGSDWGSVHVALGETRVLAQVTCSVVQPKASRPTEGLLYVKLELGPMAAPHFEANRAPTEQCVQYNRILERAFKDSNCVDLESLCIVADEKVWSLRVDVNVLNHEGNIVDCAAVAMLAALAHFKRPDVTIDGEEVIVHTLSQKDPIPLVLHHWPICVSYGIFQNGTVAIADPTNLEERCAEAHLVLGLNSYRELCGLHFGGVTMASSQLLLKCASRGAGHARQVVDRVKAAVKRDAEQREDRTVPRPSFTECVRLQRLTAVAQDRLAIRLKRFRMDGGDDEVEEDAEDEDAMQAEEDETKEDDVVEKSGGDDSVVVSLDGKSAALVPQTPKWLPESDYEHSDEDASDKDLVGAEREPAAIGATAATTKLTEKTKKLKKSKAVKKAAAAARAALATSSRPATDDSEEEDTVVMETIE